MNCEPASASGARGWLSQGRSVPRLRHLPAAGRPTRGGNRRISKEDLKFSRNKAEYCGFIPERFRNILRLARCPLIEMLGAVDSIAPMPTTRRLPLLDSIPAMADEAPSAYVAAYAVSAKELILTQPPHATL